MSRTYEIGCRACRTSLWIGQTSPNRGPTIYRAPSHLDALDAFLFAHIGHDLVVVDSEARDDDWTEIEVP